MPMPANCRFKGFHLLARHVRRWLAAHPGAFHDDLERILGSVKDEVSVSRANSLAGLFFVSLPTPALVALRPSPSAEIQQEITLLEAKKARLLARLQGTNRKED